ncbi:ABC transporter substrate-binding protein [Streptomyces tsukubensis]|uniref:ABC transporter substrate-binding protein n=1 Tax=Streptomyces tsukubensis TaxID=83656 RepID=A0A1V4A7H2_9ACTN|nr:ABC transporter substrate-binding protein [Streptomyces tsukubensis]QFR97511.1 ABC transporter substrate-binding protein [Streptomyces tsukubensis]
MWEFTDDRGVRARAARRPERVVAYVRAGAALWELGLRPVAVYGSGHDGDAIDPVKAGELATAAVPYLGAGKTLDEHSLAGARPDLIVDVTYDDRFAYAVDDGVAERLGVPVVALSVGSAVNLSSMLGRFAELATSLGAGPREAAEAELALAEDAVRVAAAVPRAPKVLALSAAGPDQVHLARPEAWPELRHLADLGVQFVSPEPGPGVNWSTTTWEYAAGLGAELVLADSRSNAVPERELAGIDAWRTLTDGTAVEPWNPELPPGARASAAFHRAVAHALTEHGGH